MRFKRLSAKILKWIFIQANYRCLNEKHFNTEKQINDIKNDISIIRDKWNVPHITAKNRTDIAAPIEINILK